MSTNFGPSSEQALQAIIPVRPARPETARASSTPAGLLRRTLGVQGRRPGAPSRQQDAVPAHPRRQGPVAAHPRLQVPRPRRTFG